MASRDTAASGVAAGKPVPGKPAANPHATSLRSLEGTDNQQTATGTGLSEYRNLLGAEYRENRDMTKRYKVMVPFAKDVSVTPEMLKKLVLGSQRIQQMIDEQTGIDPKQRAWLVKKIRDMLEEIALAQSLPVIRTLGTLLNGIFDRIYSGLYVNEVKLKQLQAQFGKQTVLYLPSHRSYGDFILMSYVLFCYNIAIPGIAAGMDFHSMAGMGDALRKTGAFYMRRSYGNDRRYWYIFREYMRQLIVAYERGIEFFIEGTRSRSNKALTPKIGLLSMALEPLFMGEVPDVLIVPVSVSYDRPLEEQLFVYELLGVPKPKETTLGMLKGIGQLMSENFGTIYLEFGDAFSAKEYFGGKLNRSQHSVAPSFAQILSKEERDAIQNLANEVVHLQQRRMVLTTFHLVALYYNFRKYQGESVTLAQLITGVRQLGTLLADLGAITEVEQLEGAAVEKQILASLDVHRNILQLTATDRTLVIAKTHHDFSQVDKRKLKGHNLSDAVMKLSVPIFSLQLYCNPCLHWLAVPAMILLVATATPSSIDRETLRRAVRQLRELYCLEFVLCANREQHDFRAGFEHLERQGLLTSTGGSDSDQRVSVVSGKKATAAIYLSVLGPFLCTYLQVTSVLLNTFAKQRKPFTEKDYLAEVQQCVEQVLLRQDRNVHPYCLSLDSISLALHSLVALGGITKSKRDEGGYVYELSSVATIEQINGQLRAYSELLPFQYLTFQSAVTGSKL